MQPPNNRDRGFFTMAQNNGSTDYVRLAYALALSLRHTQEHTPWLSIGITPGTEIPDRYRWAFDNVIEIPWGDGAEHSDWKLENEWKAAWMTPYQHTIKLDADMLFFSDVSCWWDHLVSQPNDVVWANRALDWKGDEVTSDFYRKAFTRNNLPNIYTACGYFRKSLRTFELFAMAMMIFWDWQRFFELYLHPDDRPSYPSTDVVFALASKMLDLDQDSFRPQLVPVFTHMKSRLQGWKDEGLSEDWRDHLLTFFNERAVCKLGNHRQFYPLHYHVKDWLTDDMIGIYERLVEQGGHGIS